MKKLFVGAIVGALSLIGVVGMSTSAMAGPKHVVHAPVHVLHAPVNPPADQIVLTKCVTVPELEHDAFVAQSNWHKGMPPAGIWVKMDGQSKWFPGSDWANATGETKVICVSISVSPGGTPTPPIATTTTAAPTVSTLPAPPPTTAAPGSPCQGINDCDIICNDAAGVDDCNICIGNNSCDVIVCPHGFELDASGNCDVVVTPPIAPPTTEASTTTTVAPTTTTTLRCFFPDFLQNGICIVPKPPVTEPEHECPPGEHPDHGEVFGGRMRAADDHVVCVPDHPIVTTTTAAPTTTTTVAPTTTTTAPAGPGSPCQGLGDCHVVCNDAAGVDDCNICLGNGDCDVVICPVGFEEDASGNCDVDVNAAPAQPIVTTTTAAPTTTTVAPTTTTVKPPHCDNDHCSDH